MIPSQLDSPGFSCHFRNLNGRYLPCIRSDFQAIYLQDSWLLISLDGSVPPVDRYLWPLKFRASPEDGTPLWLHRTACRAGGPACGHRAAAGDDHQPLGSGAAKHGGVHRDFIVINSVFICVFLFLNGDFKIF